MRLIAKKNLFLTGCKNAGKSTLINKILQSNSYSIGGFKTLPYYEKDKIRGYYISGLMENIKGNRAVISRKISDMESVAFLETFEIRGVEILEKSLRFQPDLILMDELGFLENKAYKFQKYIKMCLDSPIPVLGVLKQGDIDFLASIRKRQDVRIIEINGENRNDNYYILEKEVKILVQKQRAKELLGCSLIKRN